MSIELTFELLPRGPASCKKLFALIGVLIILLMARIATDQPARAEEGNALSGVYDLFPLDQPNRRVEGFIVKSNGQDFLVSGSDQSWAGHGKTDGRTGFYDWKFADGKAGRTAFRVNPDGSLQGHAVGSGIDFVFLARRTQSSAQDFSSQNQPLSTARDDLAVPGANFPSRAGMLSQEAIRHLLHQCVQMMFHVHGAQEVMSIAREIDTYPEVSPAFPFVGEEKGAYAECLANARGFIGGHYFFGAGVGQNYAEAAKWLTKAVNSPIVYEVVPGGISHHPSMMDSWRQELGFLYVYGLGVPQDRARARKIWASIEDIDEHPPMTKANLLRFIDRHSLPETVESFDGFRKAVAEIAEKEAQERAIAEQKREREEAAATAKYNREHPETARSSDQGSGSGYSRRKSNCTFGDSMFAPRNTLGGLYLGGGC